MSNEVARELATLSRLGVADLRTRYAEIFGEETRSGNRPWLVKRIAWRIQALAEGDLSERARKRADELARDADIRLSSPRVPPAVPIPEHPHDRRLPPVGSVLSRRYKGRTLQVGILEEGFEFAGVVYRSLSAVAKVITGSHCNGYLFFGLTKDGNR